MAGELCCEEYIMIVNNSNELSKKHYRYILVERSKSHL